MRPVRTRIVIVIRAPTFCLPSQRKSLNLCSGLNETGPCRLVSFNAKSAFKQGLGVPLLEEASPMGVGVSL